MVIQIYSWTDRLKDTLITVCCTHTRGKVITRPPQSHLGRASCHPSRQRMDSSTVCASCAMSTAAGMLHPYHFSPLTVDSFIHNPKLYPNPNPSYRIMSPHYLQHFCSTNMPLKPIETNGS